MFSQMSVCPQSASWIMVHCSALLQRGRYASYWNALLLNVQLHRYAIMYLSPPGEEGRTRDIHALPGEVGRTRDIPAPPGGEGSES